MRAEEEIKKVVDTLHNLLTEKERNGFIFCVDCKTEIIEPNMVSRAHEIVRHIDQRHVLVSNHEALEWLNALRWVLGLAGKI